MSAGGHSMDWYIGASSGMPPIHGLNTSMKPMLTALMMSARRAASDCLRMTAAMIAMTSTAAGTMSEMSRIHTASGLANTL